MTAVLALRTFVCAFRLYRGSGRSPFISDRLSARRRSPAALRVTETTMGFRLGRRDQDQLFIGEAVFAASLQRIPRDLATSQNAGKGGWCSGDLIHDDLVMGGIVGEGSADADDSIAWGDQSAGAAPVEDEGAELIAFGDVGHGEGGHTPEEGHGAGGLGVVGQGQGRRGVALFRQGQGGPAGMGGDHQERGVQAAGDVAGGLDHAFGDRLDPAGARHRLVLAPHPAVAVGVRPAGLGPGPGRDSESANMSVSASLTIWLIMATASTGY